MHVYRLYQGFIKSRPQNNYAHACKAHFYSTQNVKTRLNTEMCTKQPLKRKETPLIRSQDTSCGPKGI